MIYKVRARIIEEKIVEFYRKLADGNRLGYITVLLFSFRAAW